MAIKLLHFKYVFVYFGINNWQKYWKSIFSIFLMQIATSIEMILASQNCNQDKYLGKKRSPHLFN